MYAAIEAGGTKWNCAVGTSPADITHVERIATTTPAATIGQAIDYLRQFNGLRAIGIGSFGPVELNPAAAHYGYITTTPKAGWQTTDVVGAFRAAFAVPVGFDTDVNGAALGEHTWGAAQGLETFVYFTIGTGIGGGAMVNGRLLHGLLHPEMGHMRLPLAAREPAGFTGICPFHGNCFEGLASGPAMQARWQTDPVNLPPTHPAWELEAHYLALGIMNAVLTLAPQRVILGGGVMDQAHLFPLVRAELQSLLNNYLQVPQISDYLDEYIVPPGLGARAGVLGALALAQVAELNAHR